MKVLLLLALSGLFTVRAQHPGNVICGRGTVLSNGYCEVAVTEDMPAPFVRARNGGIEMGINGALLTLTSGEVGGHQPDPTADDFVTVRENFLTDLVSSLIDDAADVFEDRFQESVDDVNARVTDLQGDVEGSFQEVQEDAQALTNEVRAELTAVPRVVTDAISDVSDEVAAVSGALDAVEANLQDQIDSLQVFAALVNESFSATLFPPPTKRSCRELQRDNPSAESGMYTIDPDGPDSNRAEIRETYCDMDNAGGGWTRFIRHSDSGNQRMPTDEFDEGIQFAMDGGIRKWMVKTFTNADRASENGDNFENAWVSTLSDPYQGSGFRHFKYQTSGCNRHRFSGHSWITRSQFVTGSSCRAFSHGGTYLWGEHPWCGTSWVGQMWWFGCSSPYSSSHLLVMNYDHGNRQTRVLRNGGSEQSSNTAYEYFFREN